MNVAVGQFGGYPILSAASVLQEFRTQGLSTDAFRGKANQFVCPQGASPGWGYFLMYRAHVVKLKAKGFYRLAFGRSDAYVDMPRIAYVGCQRLHGGVQEDPAAICLVRVTDRRGLMRLTSSTSRFNIRNPDAWMEFMPGSSSDEETPWTWQEAWERLWVDIEELAGRVPPELPYEPHGYPDGLWYVGRTAWEAVNDFCRRLMLGLSYDPITDKWALFELGENDKALELIMQENQDLLLDTTENVERESPWGVPSAVRVLFRRHVTTVEDALAQPVAEERVTASDIDEELKTDDGTELVLHDDLRAEPSGEAEPDEDSDEDREARARERAEKFYQMTRGLQPLTTRWRGGLPFTTGRRVQEVRWADFGDDDGPQTIVIRRPVELWKWHASPLVLSDGEGGNGGRGLSECRCGNPLSQLLGDIPDGATALVPGWRASRSFATTAPELLRPGMERLSKQRIVWTHVSGNEWVSQQFKLGCCATVEGDSDPEGPEGGDVNVDCTCGVPRSGGGDSEPGPTPVPGCGESGGGVGGGGGFPGGGSEHVYCCMGNGEHFEIDSTDSEWPFSACIGYGGTPIERGPGLDIGEVCGRGGADPDPEDSDDSGSMDSDDSEPCVPEDQRVGNYRFRLRLYPNEFEGEPIQPKGRIRLEHVSGDDCGFEFLAISDSVNTMAGGLFTVQDARCIEWTGCFCVEATAADGAICGIDLEQLHATITMTGWPDAPPPGSVSSSCTSDSERIGAWPEVNGTFPLVFQRTPVYGLATPPAMISCPFPYTVPVTLPEHDGCLVCDSTTEAHDGSGSYTAEDVPAVTTYCRQQYIFASLCCEKAEEGQLKFSVCVRGSAGFVFGEAKYEAPAMNIDDLEAGTEIRATLTAYLPGVATGYWATHTPPPVVTIELHDEPIDLRDVNGDGLTEFNPCSDADACPPCPVEDSEPEEESDPEDPVATYCCHIPLPDGAGYTCGGFMGDSPETAELCESIGGTPVVAPADSGECCVVCGDPPEDSESDDSVPDDSTPDDSDDSVPEDSDDSAPDDSEDSSPDDSEDSMPDDSDDSEPEPTGTCCYYLDMGPGECSLQTVVGVTQSECAELLGLDPEDDPGIQWSDQPGYPAGCTYTSVCRSGICEGETHVDNCVAPDCTCYPGVASCTPDEPCDCGYHEFTCDGSLNWQYTGATAPEICANPGAGAVPVPCEFNGQGAIYDCCLGWTA